MTVVAIKVELGSNPVPRWFSTWLSYSRTSHKTATADLIKSIMRAECEA